MGPLVQPASAGVSHRRLPPLRPCAERRQVRPPQLNDDAAGFVQVPADALNLVTSGQISATTFGRYLQAGARAWWACNSETCGCGRAHISGAAEHIWQIGPTGARNIVRELQAVGLAERRPRSATTSFTVATGGLTARALRALGRDSTMSARSVAVWAAVDLAIGTGQRLPGGGWSDATDAALAARLRLPLGAVRGAVSALAAAGWLQVVDTTAGRVLVLRDALAAPWPELPAEVVDKPRRRRREKCAIPQPKPREKCAIPQTEIGLPESDFPPTPRETQDGAAGTVRAGEEHDRCDGIGDDLRALLGPNNRRELDALRVGRGADWLDWPKLVRRVVAAGALQWPQAELAAALARCVTDHRSSDSVTAVALHRWKRAVADHRAAPPPCRPPAPAPILVDDSAHLAALAAAPAGHTLGGSLGATVAERDRQWCRPSATAERPTAAPQRPAATAAGTDTAGTAPRTGESPQQPASTAVRPDASPAVRPGTAAGPGPRFAAADLPPDIRDALDRRRAARAGSVNRGAAGRSRVGAEHPTAGTLTADRPLTTGAHP